MLSWLKSHKLIVLAILLAALGVWYFFIRRPQVEYTQYSVQQQDLVETLELSGKISAANSATLRFGAGGLVTYLGAQEGDTVKKWTTLASIDTRQLQKTMTQKLNLYAIERTEFDQGQDDYDKNIRDGDIDKELRRLLQKNQYQLDNTVKDVEYQDLALRLTRLTSPLNGVLIQSPITTSNVQVLATDTWVVVDPTSLYFSADVDETDLSRISVGQAVRVELDAFPESVFPASISSISYSPKETTSGTTYEVKVKFADLDSTRFRLGLNGTAAVILEQMSAIPTLPLEAVTGQNGDAYVYVKSGKKYVRQNVTTGIEDEGVVEISSGLSTQDVVYAPK